MEGRLSHRPTGSAARPDPLLGQVFDERYRVLSAVGRGAMGTVYEAEQLSMMNRKVALKVIRKALVGDHKREGRFLREARAAGRLQHPNTIRLYDYGKSDDGRVYIVTELLRGHTVGHLLRTRGRFEPHEAVRIGTEVVKALGEAHAAGLVHRDLKPDNIFLVPRESDNEPPYVKVLDFGLVKYVTGTDSLGQLTLDGVVGGTPGYMSPENAQGYELDGRADIYSVGVLLYEMLTGRRPFRAADSVHVLLAHINEPPPPLVVPGIRFSDDLLDVVYHCLQKKREHRPRNAEAVRDALERLGDVVVRDDDAEERLRGKGNVASQAAMTLPEQRLNDIDTIMLDADEAAPYVAQARAPVLVDPRQRARIRPPDPRPGPAPVRRESAPGLPSFPDDVSTAEVPAPGPEETAREPTVELRAHPPEAPTSSPGPGPRAAPWKERVNWEAVVVWGMLGAVVLIGGLVAAVAFGLL